MARGRRIKKKLQDPDPVYSNRLLTRFINRSMRDGKKSTAQRQVYTALENIKKKGEDPMKVFEAAVNNVGPKMEVKTRRVGGASYQVPLEVRGDRRISLAIRWLVMFARKRSNKEFKTFADKLTAEFLDAYSNQGEAVKKKDTVHRMADSNKAFAHFRW
ncbi:30S ribosomal protein S7 [Patescibacteria group bacterium]